MCADARGASVDEHWTIDIGTEELDNKVILLSMTSPCLVLLLVSNN